MRSILVLITVTDKGDIRVDVRGPHQGAESITTILDSARQLVEQGNFSDDKKTS
jgi:hypothetical protein